MIDIGLCERYPLPYDNSTLRNLSTKRKVGQPLLKTPVESHKKLHESSSSGNKSDYPQNLPQTSDPLPYPPRKPNLDLVTSWLFIPVYIIFTLLPYFPVSNRTPLCSLHNLLKTTCPGFYSTPFPTLPIIVLTSKRVELIVLLAERIDHRFPVSSCLDDFWNP